MLMNPTLDKIIKVHYKQFDEIFKKVKKLNNYVSCLIYFY